jgi:hypothetical protein
MHLSKGTTTSLEAPLRVTARLLNANNDVAACNTLGAFLDQVNAKEANGQLTLQEGANLRQQATDIQHSVGCFSPSSSLSSSGENRSLD